MERFFAWLGGESKVIQARREQAALDPPSVTPVVDAPVDPTEGGSVTTWQPPDPYERARLQSVITSLGEVEPFGDVTEAALSALRAHFEARLTLLGGAPAVLPKVAPADAPAVAQAPHADVPKVAATPKAPRVSLREFLAERSILIVSYAGAFLLIVATLLFELYAGEGLSGAARTGAVLALDLAFGAAAWACFRVPRLRLVGATYLAIFALILPLVFVAGYVFLFLRERGITIALAQAAGGLSCAFLYMVLAARLQSRGYASLALLAGLIGWSALVVLLGLDRWHGAGMTPLVALLGVVASPLGRQLPGAVLLRAVAQPFAHLAAFVALAWTFAGVSLAGSRNGVFAGADSAWSSAATLGGLAVAYAVFGLVLRNWAVASGIAALVTGTFVFVGFELEWEPPAFAVMLVALAWVYAVAAGRVPASGWPGLLRALAALQALVSIVLPGAGGNRTLMSAINLAVQVGAGGLAAFMGYDTRALRAAPAWLLLTALHVSIAWIWLALTVLPATESSFEGLLTAYAPLPVLFAVAAFTVRRRAGWRWAAPLYAAAALNAAWIALGVQLEDALPLRAAVLLTFGIALYVLTALERQPLGVPVAGLVLLGGAVASLRAMDAPPEAWPLVLVALSAALYLPAGLAPNAAELSPLREAHRLTGLTGAGLVALGSFWSTALFRSEIAGPPLAGLGALLVFVALLAWDARSRRSLGTVYAAGAALSLAGIWVARMLGTGNPEWYVLLPGLYLTWAGIRLPGERKRGRLRVSHATARLVVLAGLALLLGTSAFQTLERGEPGQREAYIVLLLVEGVAAVLIGIVVRQRAVALAGATGVAGAALWALVLVLESVPLFAVFGVIALVLLALGALLAVLRERLGGGRASGITGRGWSDWD